MKIEHLALQVADPVAVARWYVEHLGLTVKRAQSEPPFGHFLADDGDAVMLEIYRHPKADVPEYRQLNPLALHVAFTTRDIEADCARLLAAGATAEGDIQHTPSGDRLVMLRDPWGVPVQLVTRAEPMIGR